MAYFSWLHLSDLHVGMKEQHWLWPGIREIFFDDLEKLHDKCGPWDLILFTGDLTQRGSSEEFQMVDELLEQLWRHFERLGSFPKLLAVPGNHDLARPRKKSPSLRALLHWDTDQELQEEFWGKVSSPYRKFIKNRFKNYMNWWRNQPFRVNGIQEGLVPGDFAATIEKGNARLGILGLNTSFLQLTADDYEGRLALHARQFQKVCGGDGPKWAKQHHACLILTHHPPVWLNPQSRVHLRSEITDHGRFAIHLCGHLHETAMREISEGGTEARRIWQGHSLFGLEYFGQSDEGQRLHGYAAGRLELHGNTGKLLFWPRRTEIRGGQRDIVQDLSVVLTDDQHTEPREFELLHALGTKTFPEENSDAQIDTNKQERRIDAIVPSSAKFAECINVLIQVRFPDSPYLDGDDFQAKYKPSSVEKTSAPAILTFPVESHNAPEDRKWKIGPCRLKFKITAPDFEIQGEKEYVVDIPPDRYSNQILFLLKPQKKGNCKIIIVVYTIEDICLGTVQVETEVNGIIASARNIATLILNIVVRKPEKDKRTLPDKHQSNESCYEGKMNYKYGFAQLKKWLEQQAPDSLVVLHTLEERFSQNEHNERIFGSSENTRNERSQIIYALNEFALEHCKTSFNDFCQGKRPKQLLAREILGYLYNQAPDDKIGLSELCQAIGESSKDAVLEELDRLEGKKYIQSKGLDREHIQCWITYDGRQMFKEFSSTPFPSNSTQIQDEQKSEDPVYDYSNMEWYSPKPPELMYENFTKFQAKTNFEAAILLMTATERELLQVLRLLKPIHSKEKICCITKGYQTYYVGQFAEFSTVVVKSDMGAVGPTAAAHTARDAIEAWSPKALLMVGIAFGANRSKHQPADVLIAEKIVPYESQRVGEKIIFRSEIPPSGLTLRNRFKNALGWSFQRPDGSSVNIHPGTILSGEKLIDDPLFKKQLIEQFPEAIGGEMEGAGVYASAYREKVEWILVKAVCDWADGRKHDGYQEMAAAAATSLTHFVLSNPNALDGLYEHPSDDSQDNMNQPAGDSERPQLPVELQNKIIDFLTSVPSIHGNSAQQAFVYSAGLDTELQREISFGGSSAQFFRLLVQRAWGYGKLRDGRNALEAVLEAAKGSVGGDRRKYCDSLIKKLRAI